VFAGEIQSRALGSAPVMGTNFAIGFGDLTSRRKLDQMQPGLPRGIGKPFGGEVLSCNRRDFLKLSAGVLAGSLLPLPALAASLRSVDARRTLALFNIHTNEAASVCYYDQGNYRPDALDKINYILRDYRSDDILPIDPLLLDQLYALKARIRPRTPFHVISGYRTPATNTMLRKASTGVARSSLHTRGQAIDIRLPGYNTRRLRDLSLKLKAGGVGYYPKSDFVHLDTGKVRTW
jgi:uncharacterized protein YcbK (DUF882 family)